jgi:hypothetical protein
MLTSKKQIGLHRYVSVSKIRRYEVIKGYQLKLNNQKLGFGLVLLCLSCSAGSLKLL